MKTTTNAQTTFYTLISVITPPFRLTSKQNNYTRQTAPIVTYFTFVGNYLFLFS